METTVYTLKHGKLTCNGNVSKVLREPKICLFCFDRPLTRAEILNLLNLSDAKIDAYVTYFCNENGKSEEIDYYMYEVFI